MNNGAKPTKLNIKAHTLPYYSASLAQSGVSPVLRIDVSGLLQHKNINLEISIVGKCNGQEFLQQSDFKKECFYVENYNLKNTGVCSFEFPFDCFSFDNVFLESLDHEEMAEIYILVNVDGVSVCEKTHIRLLGASIWQGLELHPDSLRNFMCPDNKIIGDITSKMGDDMFACYNAFDDKKIFSVIEQIYKSIKSCNIIYSRPSFYSASAMQKVRCPDDMFAGSSVLSTPLELALLFSACAAKKGFDTSLLFVSGHTGVVKVMCGIYTVKNECKNALIEDMSLIVDMVKFGELIVVEPSVFAAAQNTSFSLACDSAKTQICQGQLSLECMINMIHGQDADKQKNYSVKQSLSELYASMLKKPVMKMLSGKESGRFTEIPLLTSEFDKFFYNDTDYIKLLPLEHNVNLLDFASLDKNFSSVITAENYGQKFSISERDAMEARFERFKTKITYDDCIVTSLSEEKLHESASNIKFAKNNNKPFAIYGYVKIKDKLTELVSFVPVCLCGIDLQYENSSFKFKQCTKPVVNKLFIRNSMKNAGLNYSSFMKASMPTDRKEIFDLFENILSALAETDDRYSYEIVREIHLISCDMTDFYLWCDIAICKEQILTSNASLGALGKNTEKTVGDSNDVYPILPSFYDELSAVRSNNDIIIDGLYSQPKIDVVSSVVARQVTEGKTSLVVVDDKAQAEYVRRKFVENKMDDSVLIIENHTQVSDISKQISDLLKKYANVPSDNLASYPMDLPVIFDRIVDYQKRINEQHHIGLSLQQAIEFYFEASSDAKGIDDIIISKDVFENIDKTGLDETFESIGTLISCARKLNVASGKDKYSPLSTHAMFRTNPPSRFSEDKKLEIKNAVKKIIPVLSEYRDVFYEVSGIIGIEENDIRTLSNVKALNELYKLILSVREIDIPEDFVKTDIDVFSNKMYNFSAIENRMKAIEFKLSFFNNEIFEDVVSLLPGEKYTDEEKGFFKKFKHRKNGQDTLAQYLKPEYRSAFQQRKLEDVYKLLYEYKSCVLALDNKNALPEDEQSKKLAQIAFEVSKLIDEICACNNSKKSKILSGVFRLITLIPVSPELARKITLARARFAEISSANNSCFEFIQTSLGLDLLNLEFNNGVLSFDGISVYLKSVVDKLYTSDAWMDWLECSNAVKQNFAQFVEYIVLHGAGENVENVFAKSILLPCINKIKNDLFEHNSDERISASKDKYIQLFLKACELSAHNLDVSYSQSVKHCSETNDGEKLLATEFLSVREMLEKRKPLVSKVKPVIIISKDLLTQCLPLSYDFDNVVILDNYENGYSMLPAISFGKRAVVCNMSQITCSSLVSTLKSSGIKTFTVGKFADNKNIYFSTFINNCVCGEKNVYFNTTQNSSVEVVRMNGIFDRTLSRINKTEAELSLSKAVELLSASPDKTVAVTAFTKQQCEYIEKNAYILSRKHTVLMNSLNNNKLVISTLDKLCYEYYDSIVVSACIGPDKNAKIGWDFSDADCYDLSVFPQGLVSISDRAFEKMYIITSLNEKMSGELRKSSQSAYCFNSLCNLLLNGNVPVYTENSTSLNSNSFVASLMNVVNSNSSKFAMCGGKNVFGANLFSMSKDNVVAVFVDNDGILHIHNELMLKDIASKAGFETTTISPIQFANGGLSKIVEAFK